MYRLFFIFVVWIPCLLHGNIDHYLKPVGEKNPIHSIRNIDYIYMINLDQRPEKFKDSVEQLAPYGILPHRFSAVNGWELTATDVNRLGVVYEPWMAARMPPELWGTYYLEDGDLTALHEPISVPGRTYYCHCMARGPIGICLSHLSIIQDAYDAGYKAVWIMEDDIQVLKNPHILSYLIDELDIKVGRNNWDILFTDQDTKNSDGVYVPCKGYAHRPNFLPANLYRFSDRTSRGRHFRQVGARYGAYSYIIRRQGMEKLLNHFKTYKLFLPFDMDFCLPNNIKLFALAEDVVSTKPNSPSDNGNPLYKERR